MFVKGKNPKNLEAEQSKQNNHFGNAIFKSLFLHVGKWSVHSFSTLQIWNAAIEGVLSVWYLSHSMNCRKTQPTMLVLKNVLVVLLLQKYTNFLAIII